MDHFFLSLASSIQIVCLTYLLYTIYTCRLCAWGSLSCAAVAHSQTFLYRVVLDIDPDGLVTRKIKSQDERERRRGKQKRNSLQNFCSHLRDAEREREKILRERERDKTPEMCVQRQNARAGQTTIQEKSAEDSIMTRHR